MNKKLTALFLALAFAFTASMAFASPIAECPVDCGKTKLYDPYHVDIQKCYPPAQGGEYAVLQAFDYESKQGNPSCPTDWCDGPNVWGIPFNLCACADCDLQSGNYQYVAGWDVPLALRLAIRVTDKAGVAKESVYWSEMNRVTTEQGFEDLKDMVRIKSFFNPDGHAKWNNEIFCWYEAPQFVADVPVKFYASDTADLEARDDVECKNPVAAPYPWGCGKYYFDKSQNPYLAAAFPCSYWCNYQPQADYLYTETFYAWQLVGAASAAEAAALYGPAAPNFWWVDVPSMVYDAYKAAYGDQVSVEVTLVRTEDDKCVPCPWVLVCDCIKPVAILGCEAEGCVFCLPYVDPQNGAFAVANVGPMNAAGTQGTVTITGSGASAMIDFEVPAMTVKVFQMADYADVLAAAGISLSAPVYAEVTTAFQAEVFALTAGVDGGFGYVPTEGACGCWIF